MSPKKNLTGITTVVLLHAVLLAAFLHGSKLTVFKSAPPVVDLIPNVEAPKPNEREPEVQEPPLARPEIYVPKLLTDIPLEPAPTVTARVAPDHPPAQPPAGGVAEPGAKTQVVKAAPVITAAVVDAQACNKPDYPKNALRNGDTGTVMLAFLIGTDGKVADARVEKSSGFRELDRAAQAGLSLCKFKPGTVDGVPQPSWTKMQYIWSLD
ncbi:TonB family protein [Duganella sp. FT94W]|uniref:TonB family protein n=1 Tax=Duganella lactea TaxID=2692173 RepID=A0ABW9VBT4_9BURK|nr:energy transducer TonB [Duganella lactea]MYM36232.1 TonB family protein [Duganella lactea]